LKLTLHKAAWEDLNEKIVPRLRADKPKPVEEKDAAQDLPEQVQTPKFDTDMVQQSTSETPKQTDVPNPEEIHEPEVDEIL